MNEETLPVVPGACPVCREGMQQVKRCVACETPHHIDCWNYNSGCAIYGCDGHVAVAMPLPVPRQFEFMLEKTAQAVLCLCDLVIMMVMGLLAGCLEVPLALVAALSSYLGLRRRPVWPADKDSWVIELLIRWYGRRRKYIPPLVVQILYWWVGRMKKLAYVPAGLLSCVPGWRLPQSRSVPLLTEGKSNK